MEVDMVNLFIYMVGAVFLMFVLWEAHCSFRFVLNNHFSFVPKKNAEPHRVPGRIAVCSARAASQMLVVYDRSAPWRMGFLPVYSILLTSVAIGWGQCMELGKSFQQALPSLIPYSHSVYRTEFLYPFNFVFFYLAVRVGVSCLRSFVRLDRGVVARAGLLAVNFFLAFVFASILLFGIKCLSSLEQVTAQDQTDLIHIALEKSISTWQMFLAAPFGEGDAGRLDWDAFLFSLPPFLPVLIYIAFFTAYFVFELFRGLPDKIAESRRPTFGQVLEEMQQTRLTGEVIHLPHSEQACSDTSRPIPSEGYQSLVRRKKTIADWFFGLIFGMAGALFRVYHWKRLLLAAKVLICLFLIVCTPAVWLFFSLPTVERSQEIVNHTSIVISKSGDDIQAEEVRKNLSVAYRTLPDHLIQALLTMEDRGFMHHWGFSIRGIGRSLVQLLRTGSIQGGGSTITQQLAKNIYLSKRQSLLRKIKDLMLALKMEMRFSKEEILEMYFNHVFMGGQCFGIEAAARKYFNKRAEDLNLYESCLLIGSIPGPNKRNIAEHPDIARRWADIVLYKMVETGAITPEQAKQAKRTGIQKGVRVLRLIEHEYFFDWIKPEIRKYCSGTDGLLTIVTTLNPEMQLYANHDTARAFQMSHMPRTAQVALLAMSPDGAVRAMVGGRDYQESQFNRAVQALRQPGSLFKPFTYIAALEAGWLPEHKILDEPLHDGWPKNWDGKYMGRISLTDAIKTSRNAATVQLSEKIGIPAVIHTARRFGIVRDMPESPVLSLGAAEVSMLEITAAYSVFANGGKSVAPYGILLIRDHQGNIVYKHRPDRRRVIEPKYLHLLNQMLTAVITPDGTGHRAAFRGHPPIAGKTGTTNDNRDAWFCGYSAHLVTSIWVGHDDNSPMRHVTGGGVPAIIWREFNSKVHRFLDLPPKPLP